MGVVWSDINKTGNLKRDEKKRPAATDIKQAQLVGNRAMLSDMSSQPIQRMKWQFNASTGRWDQISGEPEGRFRLPFSARDGH